MDYRLVDEIETDYGTLVVTHRAPTILDYIVLTLRHEGWGENHFLAIDTSGQPHPESERVLQDSLRRTYEARGPMPLADRERDWASDYLGGDYDKPDN